MPMIGKIYLTESEARTKARYASLEEMWCKVMWDSYRCGCVDRKTVQRALDALRLARLCQKWEAENG